MVELDLLLCGLCLPELCIFVPCQKKGMKNLTIQGNIIGFGLPQLFYITISELFTLKPNAYKSVYTCWRKSHPVGWMERA